MEAGQIISSKPIYQVATPVYEGPMDLLLQLIEREELDITKVSLAKVTNPFLEYARQLKTRHAEEVSSFLVMAARLMQIKSEALLPRPPVREPGEEDPGEELVNQLLKYKQYKEIAAILNNQIDLNYRTYLRLAAPPKLEAKLDLSGIGLDDLVNSAAHIFELASKPGISLNTVVNAPRITIKDKIQYITQTLKDTKRSTFQKLVGKNTNRVEIVVTFLALLELVKRFRIQAVQEQLFGDIEIEQSDNWKESTDFELEFTE